MSSLKILKWNILYEMKNHLEYEDNREMYKIVYKVNIKQIPELKTNENKTIGQSLTKTDKS